MRNHTGWLVGVLLLAGCGTGSAEVADPTEPPAVSDSTESSDALDSTEFVCDDFAYFVRDGRPADQRSEVISGIGDLIDNADSGVREAFDPLTATVNGTPGAQQIADDTFAQACFDAGWEG